MLYLPAQQFFHTEIRLPAAAGDLVTLCALFPECEDFQPTVSRLFRGSPGLLLYCVKQFVVHNSVAELEIESLLDWMKTSMFDTSIESDAFELADELPDRHLEKLLAWQAKPNRKRLAGYLAVLSEVDVKFCKTIVRDLFSTEELLGQLVAGSQETVAAQNETADGKLPVRSMWLMVAKLQRLEISFDAELNSQKMAAMKQLAYGASHEINNPLANIATRAQALMSDESSPAKRQKLAVIYAQAMRAHEMISDMMLFAHPPELQVETGDVVELVEQLGRELRNQLRRNKIKLGIHPYPNVPACEFDTTKVAVALKAIIENSIEAISSGGDGGEIRVQIWAASEQELGIAVVDDGPGIAADTMTNLFDPFYSGREAGRGLGFGLSKAWRIAELHGGMLEVDGTHQAGARVVMKLPLKQQSQKKISRIDNLRAA